MKEIILIKNGEIALKGLNRSTFEDVLVKNMKRRLLKSAGKFTFTKSQSTIVAEPVDEDVLVPFSAEKGTGREELLSHLSRHFS